jgi:hypothetical protein
MQILKQHFRLKDQQRQSEGNNTHANVQKGLNKRNFIKI